MKKTKRIDFNYTPLQVSASITTVDGAGGTVPAIQTFDNNGGLSVYAPDYTIVPISIQPNVSILDQDGVLPSGCVNGSLSNCKWVEWIDGTATTIESTNTNYDISANTATDATQGRITVKRNCPVNGQLTLEFRCQYLDPRNGEVHEVRQSFTLRCESVTEYPPKLSVDIPAQSFWNPLADPSQRVITARLYQGGKEVATANRIFVWEEMDASGNWVEIDPDGIMNYDVSVNDNQLTVLRDYMGYGLKFRVRAKYDKGGNPSGVTLTESSPSAIFAITRRLPDYDYEISGQPANVPPSQKYLFPEVAVTGKSGDIDKTRLDGVIAFDWYIATNTASGNGQSFTKVATGRSPQIPTAAMAKSYGGVLAVEDRDLGPWAAALDSDGSVFTDADGKVLLIK